MTKLDDYLVDSNLFNQKHDYSSCRINNAFIIIVTTDRIGREEVLLPVKSDYNKL